VTRIRVPYAGVATRGVALAIDCALSQGIFVVGAALAGLVGSLVGEVRPGWIVPTALTVGWAVTVATYFVAFWTTTGQTPGMRLMHVRVVARDGTLLRPGRALVRLAGLLLAIVPLFAGFLPALVDDRRRALPDLLAATVVVYADIQVTAADVVPGASLVADEMSGQPS
jgi:uncharacterized RDD family membrane protein YckC